RPAGGNHALFRRYPDTVWKIDTSHFDPCFRSRIAGGVSRAKPLDEVLVTGSTYQRRALKIRLFQAGLKRPLCELCGQGAVWRGLRMALILDHINGVPDDNRLENLRIVCPNCAATLDTHCARKNRLPPVYRGCKRCGESFVVRRPEQRY